MKQKIPSVEELIRKHSKARVIKTGAKVPAHFSDLMIRRPMEDQDVIDEMIRKYA